MNKTELTRKLADRTSLGKAEAQRVVDALFDAQEGIISQVLQDRKKLQITGFGTFETRERAARRGRNPQTGEAIQIGPSTSAAFRPGKALKQAVS